MLQSRDRRSRKDDWQVIISAFSWASKGENDAMTKNRGASDSEWEGMIKWIDQSQIKFKFVFNHHFFSHRISIIWRLEVQGVWNSECGMQILPLLFLPRPCLAEYLGCGEAAKADARKDKNMDFYIKQGAEKIKEKIKEQ